MLRVWTSIEIVSHAGRAGLRHEGVWGVCRSFIISLPTLRVLSNPFNRVMFRIKTLDYFRLTIRPENID
jgi:hypothetical protein